MPEDDKNICLRFETQTHSPATGSRKAPGPAPSNLRLSPRPARFGEGGHSRILPEHGSRVGFALLVIFLIALYARPFDFAHINTPILQILGIPAVLIAFLTRGFLRPFATSIGVFLLCFTVWIMVAVPFSLWKGGSFNTFRDWLRSLVLFVLVSSFVVTLRHLRAAVTVIAASVVAVSVMSLLVGSTESGRLSVAGKFGNPNDLAQVIVIALPLLWFIASRANLPTPWRVLAALCMAPLFLAFAKTGSRGGLVTLACTLAAYLLLTPASRRLMIVAGLLIMGAVSFAVLPEDLRQRFTNISGERSEEYDPLQQSAVGSFQDRRRLLKDSIELTLAHPLVGVGPGQFSVAQNELAISRGAPRGSWLQTHNTYTQVSSETGIPGLIFYCAALFGVFRALRFKAVGGSDEIRELRVLGQFLRLSLLAFAVSAMFSVSAYDSHLPVLAGLAVAFSNMAKPICVPAAPQPARRT